MKQGIENIKEAIEAVPVIFEKAQNFASSEESLPERITDLLATYLEPKVQAAIKDSTQIGAEIADVDTEEARELAHLSIDLPFQIMQSAQSGEGHLTYKLTMYRELLHRAVDVVFDTIEVGKQVGADELPEPNVTPQMPE